MAVCITTLGTLRVELDGRVLDRLPSARNRSALLVYLAVEREVVREAAMGVLWPDRPPARARHLLSQTLYELRQELGEGWVSAAGERLHATDALQIDAVELADAVETGEYDRAAALYQGPFLPGAALAVSRPMEGWIGAQQARLTRLHRRARRGAIDGCVAEDRLRDALALARRWVEADPLDDEAQHRFIELLAATGDRSGALRQYDQYSRLMGSELELEPLEETRALVQRIREGEVGARRTERVAEPRPAYAAVAGGSGVEPAGTQGTEATSDLHGPPSDFRSDSRSDSGRSGGARSADSWIDSFLDRLGSLRHRRSVQWTLAYLAGSVVLLEGMEILTEAFALSGLVLQITALILALGAIVVLGAGWYLADRQRRFGKPEMALTLLVATFVLSLPVWFARAVPGPVMVDGLNPNRLAVLYFDDMSEGGALSHLAAGFTESLIHELSQVEGLDVVSRRAVAGYRETPELSYDSIVAELEASTLVEGSVTAIGDRIRLTIQLIDGGTSSHLLSATIERSADSLDQLLVALPEEAARLLRKRLGDWVRLRAMETAATSTRALELIQRVEPMMEDARAVGRSDLQASLPLLERADSMLAEAERLDPGWPEPIMMRAELAAIRARATAAIPTQYEPGATRTAFDHLDRVLTRWPAYPPALAKRGNLRFELAQSGVGSEAELLDLYREAEADLRKAILEDEKLTDGWWGLSKLLLSVNAYAEARRTAVRAVETDSYLTQDAGKLWHLFLVSLDAEDHPGARQWCDEIGDRYPGQQHSAYCELFLLTSSPSTSPDPERAWSLAADIIALSSDQQRDIYRGYTALQVAKVLVRAGLEDSARAVVSRATPTRPLPTWAPYDVAHVHLLLGEEERALDVLEQYFEWNPVRAQRLARDWWFRRLHGHPRFESLLGRGAG